MYQNPALPPDTAHPQVGRAGTFQQGPTTTPLPTPPGGHPRLGPVLHFPPPVPYSHVVERAKAGTAWLWEGYLPLRAIALLTALWKSGKTTLLADLLKALSGGTAPFLGRPLRRAKALVVTQEADDVWAGRAGVSSEWVFFQRGEGDHPRPFRTIPRLAEWEALAAHLAGQVSQGGFGLVVIDPLADFWPVGDENNPAEVSKALLPLRAVADAGACVLLLHHPKKGAAWRGRPTGAAASWRPSPTCCWSCAGSGRAT